MEQSNPQRGASPPRTVHAAAGLVALQAAAALAVVPLVLELAGLGRDGLLATVGMVVAVWLVTSAGLWAIAAAELDRLEPAVRLPVLGVEVFSAVVLAAQRPPFDLLTLVPMLVVALLLAPPARHAFGRRRFGGR